MQNTCAYLILSCFFLAGLGTQAFAQNNERTSTNIPPTFHMTGSAELLSHYVEHGISQTNKSPSLQGSFWFNFGPQARIGVWGSNVSYESEDAHFLLRPTADLKVIFSPTTDLVLSYAENKFYNSTTRNFNSFLLELTTFGYRVKYELISNWEGTSTSAAYFSLGTTWNVFGNWKWNNEAGYSMLKATGYNNYFDFKSFLGRNLGQVLVQGGLTGTSSNDQFHSAGGYFLIVKASTEF